MIEEIFIAARGEGQDEYTTPSDRQLSVAVIAGNAYLSLHDTDGKGRRLPEPSTNVVVPARSLLLALQAALADEEDAR